MKRSDNPAWVSARIAGFDRKIERCLKKIAGDPNSVRVAGWQRAIKEARAHKALLELGTDTPDADIEVPAGKLKAKGNV